MPRRPKSEAQWGPLDAHWVPLGGPLGLLWGQFSGKGSKQMSQKPLQEALPTKTLKMEILRPPWEGKILHFHWRGVQKQRFAESVFRLPTGPPKPPKTVTFGRLWAPFGAIWYILATPGRHWELKKIKTTHHRALLDQRGPFGPDRRPQGSPKACRRQGGQPLGVWENRHLPS